MKTQLILYPKNVDELVIKDVLKELNFNYLKFGSTYVEALSNTSEYISIDYINERFKKHKIDVDIISYIPVYDSSDINKYEFFYCTSGENVDTSIKVLPENNFLENKSFDCSDFCENCILGMKQKGSLYVKGINKNKIEKQKLLISSNGLWFISENFMNVIIDNQISGVDFLDLYDYKGNTIESIKQLKPKSILNEVFLDDCLVPRKKYNNCDCGKNTYVFKNLNSIYLRECKKEFLCDFNELNERTNRINGMYILSNNFVDLLIKNDIKIGSNICFYPCHFSSLHIQKD